MAESMAGCRLTWCWRRSWEFNILIWRQLGEESPFYTGQSLSTRTSSNKASSIPIRPHFLIVLLTMTKHSNHHSWIVICGKLCFDVLIVVLFFGEILRVTFTPVSLGGYLLFIHSYLFRVSITGIKHHSQMQLGQKLIWTGVYLNLHFQQTVYYCEGSARNSTGTWSHSLQRLLSQWPRTTGSGAVCLQVSWVFPH